MGVPLDNPADKKPQPPDPANPKSTLTPQQGQGEKDYIQKLMSEEASKRKAAADPNTDALSRETMLRDASLVHSKRKAVARAYETAMGFPSIYDKRNGK